ncbi:MAG: hypothetical protein AAF628_27780 [Planctomycetota bacterium]
MLACFACHGVHLHNEAEAERARKALATYDEVELDALTETGITNVERLTESEKETRRKFHRIALQIELCDVIGGVPTRPQERDLTGWRLLAKQVNEEAAAYPAASLDAILNKPSNERGLALDVRSLRSATDEFRGFNPESPLPTDLEKIPADETALEALFIQHGTGNDEKGEYETLYRRANAVREMQTLVDAAAVPLPEELSTKIRERRAAIRERKHIAANLESEFIAAKKTVAEAEKQLALAEEKKDTQIIDALREKLGRKLRKVTRVLEEGLEKTEEIPAFSERLKVTALMDVITRIEGLREGSVGHGVAASMLEVLRTDNEISERLGLGSPPPINALLLELALHQLRYEQAIARQGYDEEDLRLLELQRETYEREASAVLSAAREVSQVPAALATTLESTPLDQCLQDAGVSAEGKEHLTRAIIFYGAARTLGRDRRNELDIERRNLVRRHSLDQSRISLTAWNAVIRSPLREIVDYHESGITSEDIAKLVYAAGLTAIAVGVN